MSAPVFLCFSCREYMNSSWPEYPSWVRTHRFHRVYPAGAQLPPDFTSPVSPLVQMVYATEGISGRKREWSLVRSAIPEDLTEAECGIPHLPMKPCPTWLGSFSLLCWGAISNTVVPFPRCLAHRVRSLAALVPEQQFNTTCLQQHRPGQYVRSHRAPASNVGFTVIGVFGSFTTPVTHIPKDNNLMGAFYQPAGSALILPCTIDGRQGPTHSVDPLTEGTRWVLTLSTITR